MRRPICNECDTPMEDWGFDHAFGTKHDWVCPNEECDTSPLWEQKEDEEAEEKEEDE